eukprot:GILI01003951.1.p1 GENE.GILI01003951.1~~GILI01003951.1.p1  ORF type:complete len:306 (-),score=83.92 GILI01003951.1:396-1313(-)
MAAQHDFVSLTHGKISYKLEGPSSGTPVVCLHGFGGSKYQYDQLSSVLSSKGHHVLSFDYYGRGESDVPDLNTQNVFSQEFFCDFLLELVKALKFDQRPFILVGYSMGGCIATVFTHKHPELVDRFILIAPAGIGQPSIGEKFVKVPLVGKALARVLLPRRLRNNLTAGLFDPASCPHIVQQARERIEKYLSKPGYVDCLILTLQNFNMWNNEEVFRAVGALKKKSLILWGDHDTLCEVRFARRIVDLLNQVDPPAEPTPNVSASSTSFSPERPCTLKIIERAAHDFVIERSEQIVSAVSEWVSQ